MDRTKFFTRLVTVCNAVVALMWLYVVVTSLMFTWKLFFDAVSTGAVIVFFIIGAILSFQIFDRRMIRTGSTVNRLVVLSTGEIVQRIVIAVAGLVILGVLLWGCILLFP